MPARIAATFRSHDEETQPPSTSGRPGSGFECDACGKWIMGEPAGAGLFVWTRGDEVRYEEPPLCETCASEITVGALMRWETEEEEEG